MPCERLLKRIYYKDNDGDGYGASDAAAQINVCPAATPPDGYSAKGNDCDDSNKAINPDAIELCDGVNNDCDKLIDEWCPPDLDTICQDLLVYTTKLPTLVYFPHVNPPYTISYKTPLAYTLPGGLAALYYSIGVFEVSATLTDGTGYSETCSFNVNIFYVINEEGYTPKSTDAKVMVKLTQDKDITVTFSEVTASGTTLAAALIDPGSIPQLPANFRAACNPAVYYDITTTADYSGDIEVSITYDPTQCDLSPGDNLTLLHFENELWRPVLNQQIKGIDTICGRVSGLSPFTIAIESSDIQSVDLPKTGQTSTYYAGDDGDLEMGVAWPDTRFTVSTIDGDCITDNLTGLMWAKDANLAGRWMTWQDALDYVASLNALGGIDGYTDWRLPNVNELESLINAGETSSAAWLKTQGFTNVITADYWSSTNTSDDGKASVWFVNMNNGTISVRSKNESCCLWPVRSGNTGDNAAPALLPKTGQTVSYAAGDDGDFQVGVAWPEIRFTVNGDCVLDNLTGLVWTKNANPAGKKSWQGALDYVASLNGDGGFGGYTDWRLPNTRELRSLINYGEGNPDEWLNSQGFTNVQSTSYWSSTTYAYNTKFAWFVYLYSSYVNAANKTSRYFVWAVRSSGEMSGYPDISVLPTSYDFGSVNAGSTSEAQSLTITNNGTSALEISSLVLTGEDSSMFKLAQDTCPIITPAAPGIIAPGESCSIMATFIPASSGVKTATLEITSNDQDTPILSLPFMGTGMAAPSTLTGLVYNRTTGTALSQAKVSIKDGSSTLTTGDGAYTLDNISTEVHGIDYSKKQFKTNTLSNIYFKSDRALTIALALQPLTGSKIAGFQGSSQISGYVYNQVTAAPLKGVKVEMVRPGGKKTATTNSDGLYQGLNIQAGIYDLKFTRQGYKPVTLKNILFLDQTPLVIDIGMTPLAVK